MFICACVVWRVYIGGICMCVFISREQIHTIILTFQSQQKEDPAGSSKYMSRENNSITQNQPPCQFGTGLPVDYKGAAQAQYLESVTVGDATSWLPFPMSHTGREHRTIQRMLYLPWARDSIHVRHLISRQPSEVRVFD